MQITEQLIERIARRVFNSMFAPALRQSNVQGGGTSGSVRYADEAGHAASADEVAWTGVTGKPSFATVATSGSYNDLSNKPSIPSVSGSVSGSTLTITINGTSYSLTDTNTWRPLGTGANDAAAGNHNHDGRYIYWGGSAANATAMTWGTLTAANGYTILSHFASSDGGDGGFAYKSGQISMQVDGKFYQREGAYECIDSGGSQTVANNLQVASVKIEETNEINSYTGMLHLNYRVNTGVSLCNGGGNVGIGTTSPSYKLHVAGAIYCSGGFTFLSDIRKKDVITYQWSPTLDMIADAPIIRYTLKGDKTGREHIGSVAQYWQKVMPETVTDTDDTLSMDGTTIALTSVIALARVVKQLEEEIALLKNGKQ